MQAVFELFILNILSDIPRKYKQNTDNLLKYKNIANI